MLSAASKSPEKNGSLSSLEMDSLEREDIENKLKKPLKEDQGPKLGYLEKPKGSADGT